MKDTLVAFLWIVFGSWQAWYFTRDWYRRYGVRNGWAHWEIDRMGNRYFRWHGKDAQ